MGGVLTAEAGIDLSAQPSPPAPREIADPLTRVRRSCARVGASPRFASVGSVHELVDEIGHLSLQAADHRAAAWSYDVVHHYAPASADDRGAVARAATYVLVLAAINYGSGYAPWLRRTPDNSTYYTLASHLTRAFDARTLYEPRALAGLSVADVAEIFGQDPLDARVRPFLAKMRRSLAQVGALIDAQPRRDCWSLLEACDFDAAKIVEALIALPTFDDRCDREEVFFYKKAQLFVADIARLGRRYSAWEIGGIDRLTLFADNAVAQVLRVLGVIEVVPGLAARIDAGEPLPVCSREEIELRASTINAGQMLIERTAAANGARKLDIIELDYYLWKISHDTPYYQNGRVRRHLSPGEFY